jgi:glutaredoxin
MRAFVIVAATLWIACSNAAGQAYRWVDGQGRVHYTQTPPPPQARDVQKKNFRPGAPGSVDLPYATQVAASKYPVTLYTQPDCGSPCADMRASLVKRAVPFREVSVLSQKEIDEMKRVSGKEDLPLLVVGSQFQVGFQEGLINSLLDTAGYPPAGPRVPLEVLRKTDPAPPSASPQASQQATGGQPRADSK